MLNLAPSQNHDFIGTKNVSLKELKGPTLLKERKKVQTFTLPSGRGNKDKG